MNKLYKQIIKIPNLIILFNYTYMYMSKKLSSII